MAEKSNLPVDTVMVGIHIVQVTITMNLKSEPFKINLKSEDQCTVFFHVLLCLMLISINVY